MLGSMSHSLARNVSPEEIELFNKLKEVGLLEDVLVQCELDLATLRAQIEAFRSRYIHAVGHLFAELDTLEHQAAELVAKRQPFDPESAERLRATQRRMDDSFREVSEAKGLSETFEPSDELKKLYREAAKRFHPDRASDDADCLRRTDLMAQVNVAYQRNDIENLRKIVAADVNAPDAIEGEEVAFGLIRAIRRIAQVRGRLQAIAHEIAVLKSGDMYRLKTKVEAEEAAGRAPLEQLSLELQKKVAEARIILEQ